MNNLESFVNMAKTEMLEMAWDCLSTANFCDDVDPDTAANLRSKAEGFFQASAILSKVMAECQE